jgi:Protein of unknown function (DUF4199)
LFFLLISFAAAKACNIPADKARSLSGLLSIIVLSVGIYIGIKQIKKSNNDSLSYKQAVFSGVKISLITAVLVSLYGLLYCTIINPDYATFMVNETQKSLQNSGLTAEDISSKLNSVKQQYSTSMQMMQGFIGQTVMGTIASLIIGLFMKTKP